MQEALVRAWQQLASLRDPDRFDAWLYRLVVNACADQARQLRRWSKQVRPLPLEIAVSDDTSSVADWEQLEHGFNKRLKPEKRAVVVLEKAGSRQPQIASVLGIPEGTARFDSITRPRRCVRRSTLTCGSQRWLRTGRRDDHRQAVIDHQMVRGDGARAATRAGIRRTPASSGRAGAGSTSDGARSWRDLVSPNSILALGGTQPPWS